MFNLFLTTEATTSGAGMLASFLPLVLVLVVFYFMLIRPQNKKASRKRQCVPIFRLVMRL